MLAAGISPLEVLFAHACGVWDHTSSATRARNMARIAGSDSSAPVQSHQKAGETMLLVVTEPDFSLTTITVPS